MRPWLTRLYPRGWRERYAIEFDALLEQCLHTPLDVVDVLLGALDAHLQLLQGENVSWRMMNMINKLRTTILIVFAAYIGFIIAGLSLLGLADDSPMIPLMNQDMPLLVAWRFLQLGSAVALVAVVIGGLPLALSLIRGALSSNHRSLALLLVPVVSFLAFLLYGGFIFLVGTRRIQIAGVYPVVPQGAFPPGNRLMLAGFMVLFILGAIASTVAVWKAVSRSENEQATFRAAGRVLSVRLYPFAFIPAVITALSMLVMLLATVVWGWISFTALPYVFFGNFGPWQTNTQAWFYGIVSLMVVCTLAAFFGLARSRSAKMAG